jgi:hypothetical protein
MAYRQFNCDIQLAGGSSLLYPRVHPDTAANIAGTKRNGQMFFETAVGAKRLQVYDEAIAAFVLVPRLDYDETVSGLWAFNR